MTSENLLPGCAWWDLEPLLPCQVSPGIPSSTEHDWSSGLLRPTLLCDGERPDLCIRPYRRETTFPRGTGTQQAFLADLRWSNFSAGWHGAEMGTWNGDWVMEHLKELDINFLAKFCNILSTLSKQTLQIVDSHVIADTALCMDWFPYITGIVPKNSWLTDSLVSKQRTLRIECCNTIQWSFPG